MESEIRGTDMARAILDRFDILMAVDSRRWNFVFEKACCRSPCRAGSRARCSLWPSSKGFRGKLIGHPFPMVHCCTPATFSIWPCLLVRARWLINLDEPRWINATVFSRDAAVTLGNRSSRSKSRVRCSFFSLFLCSSYFPISLSVSICLSPFSLIFFLIFFPPATPFRGRNNEL